MHVTQTEADDVVWDGTNLVVKDVGGGTVSSTLSDGRTIAVQVPAAPAAIDLTGNSWSLAAEDWKPTAPYGTVGAAGAETTKHPVNVTLSEGLKAWPDIPELQWAAGIGTYRTTLSLPSDWNASHGATISLGQVTDTVTIKVNGSPVQVNQLSATADLGKLMKAGSNELEIVVATPLQNRLAQLNPAVYYNTRGVLENGLVGPVVVTPYSTAAVVSATTPTPTPTVTPTPTPTPTATPTPPVLADKVVPRIGTKVVKPLEVGNKARLRVTVRAADVVPSGAVKIRVVGPGKRKTYTRTLNVRGRTKVWLPAFGRTGKVTIRVTYLGDAAVEAKRKTIELKVVDRRAVR